MIRRAWQSSMIALARSDRVKAFMQTSRATSFLRRKFVAGDDASAGVQRAQHLLKHDGIHSSLFYMGEYVDNFDLVKENVLQKLGVVEDLRLAGLDIHVSVDPTQIGYQVDPNMLPEFAGQIAEKIATAKGNGVGLNCLMFDMEDATLLAPTISLHNSLQDSGYPVALTLQAYLRRTYDDMKDQISRGSRVRLVKGAFAAGPEIAFQTQAEIKANSRKIIDLMFSRRAKENGFYPIVATHDTRLHEYTIRLAKANDWPDDSYEFEMLLGVREDLAKNLALRGQRVRLYVPFGKDWWSHAVRRIGENPRNAALLGKALLK